MPSKDYINIVNLPESTIAGSASYTIPSGKVGIARVKAGAAAFTVNGVEKMPAKLLIDTSTTLIHYGNSGRPNGVAYSCYTATQDCVAVLRGNHTANAIVEMGFIIGNRWVTRWNSGLGSGYSTVYLRSGDVVQIFHHTGTSSGNCNYYWTVYSAEGASESEQTFTLEAGSTISGGDYTLEIYKR